MPNSAKWHSSKTQVLCGFEPNSAISLSQAAQCLGTQVALWGGGYGRALFLGTQVTVLVPGGDRSGPTEAAAETAALGRRGFLRAAGKRPSLGSVAGPGGFSLCPT